MPPPQNPSIRCCPTFQGDNRAFAIERECEERGERGWITRAVVYTRGMREFSIRRYYRREI